MKTSLARKHLFYMEMAKLLEAGFGIREAATVLSGTGLAPAEAKILNNLELGLASGKSIADALTGGDSLIGPLEQSLLAAGERGGSMPSTMRHLADYFGTLASSRREVMKALIHPTVTLHLAIFIATVPTALVTGDRSMGAIALSFFTSLLVVYLIVFLLVLLVRTILKLARDHASTDRFLHRIPLLGKTRNATALSRFCKVYHTCLLAGIPMADTVRMSVDAAGSGMIRDAGKRLKQTLAQGQPLGPVFTSEAAFPKDFARSYTIGENAGTLDKDLAHWSAWFQETSKAGIQTLASVVPKALYFLMLLYAAWKIIGFYDSYYGKVLEELDS